MTCRYSPASGNASRTCAVIERPRPTGFECQITPVRDAVAGNVRNYLVLDRRLGDETIGGSGDGGGASSGAR